MRKRNAAPRAVLSSAPPVTPPAALLAEHDVPPATPQTAAFLCPHTLNHTQRYTLRTATGASSRLKHPQCTRTSAHAKAATSSSHKLKQSRRNAAIQLQPPQPPQQPPEQRISHEAPAPLSPLSPTAPPNQSRSE